MRLHKYIAHSGVCSRRKAEELIAAGRVTVNGQPVVEMGVKVEATDVVAVDGKRVEPAAHQYLVLNKPRGVVTTLSDPQRRPTVADYLPTSARGVKPVGRLDMDTDGLLILTNDGDFAMRLAHPRYEVDKEYEALVEGVPSEEALERLRRGVTIDGERTAPAQVRVLGVGRDGARLSIIIHEGKNRQIRRMAEAVGHAVLELRRIRIGPLRLKGMRPGEARLIGVQQVAELKRLVGLTESPAAAPKRRVKPQ